MIEKAFNLGREIIREAGQILLREETLIPVTYKGDGTLVTLAEELS